MRNPRFFSFARKIFGLEPKVISLGSFRRSRIYVHAAGAAAKTRLGIEDVVPPLRDLLWDKSLEDLGLLALKGKDLARAIRKTARALRDKLPAGPLKTPEELEELLSEFGREVRAAKAREHGELEQFLSKGGDKNPVADAQQRLREGLIAKAANRARLRPVSDDDYDQAHGPYGAIPCPTVFRKDRVDLDSLLRAIREQFAREKYRETAVDADKVEGEIEQWLTIQEAGGLLLLDGWVPGDAWPEFYRRVAPVLRIDIPAVFDKEGWTSFLHEESGETDRHCSTPGTLPEVGDLLEEDDDADFIRRIVVSWSGDPAALARAYQVRVERIAPYMVQFDPLLLEKIWEDKRLFCELKASPRDRFSLASPWCSVDLLNQLGGGEQAYEPVEKVSLRFVKRP